MRTKNDFKLLQGLSLEMKIKKSKQRIKEFVEEYGQKNIKVLESQENNNKVLLSIINELGYKFKEFSTNDNNKDLICIVPMIANTEFWIDYWIRNSCNNYDYNISIPLLTWTQKDIDTYIKNYIKQL